MFLPEKEEEKKKDLYYKRKGILKAQKRKL